MSKAVAPISIQDESAYVKVSHGDGVVIYYVKASLVVQKLNSDIFMLKNDSLVTYYSYKDVIKPGSVDLDDLIQKIASWNTALSNTFGTINTSTMYIFKPSASNTTSNI